MTQLTEKEQQEISDAKAVSMFARLIDKTISKEELAEILDDLIWQHTQYMLADPNMHGHQDNPVPLYFLRELRDICLCKPRITENTIYNS